MKDLSQPGSGLSYLESIVRYIFNATDRLSADEVKEIVDQNIPKDKEDIIMTIAEQLVQQGEIKMAKEAIVDVLEARFNDIPVSLKEKLANVADRAVLGNLLKRAVVISSIAELEKEIPVGSLS